MTDYIVSDQNLSAVASAIRSKADIQGGLSFPAGFIDAVNSIETGGGGDHEAEDALIDGILSGTYVNNRVGRIRRDAFRSLSYLTGVECGEVLSILASAFYYCSSLESVSFPKCTYIGENAFASCGKLIEADFPEVTQVYASAFAYCKGLVRASFPKCKTFYSSVFYACTSLRTVYAPSISTIGNACFQSCYYLEEAKFLNCASISSAAFRNDYALNTISFPNVISIQSSVFAGCSKLLSCYFLGSSVPNLAYPNIFYNTPISTQTSYTSGKYGSIYVRASLVDAFISASNWSFYSSRIVGLTDEEIAALNEGE